MPSTQSHTLSKEGLRQRRVQSATAQTRPPPPERVHGSHLNALKPGCPAVQEAPADGGGTEDGQTSAQIDYRLHSVRRSAAAAAALLTSHSHTTRHTYAHCRGICNNMVTKEVGRVG